MVFLIFIFGLLIGSFLNVCIYRIPRDESIVFPPSHCTVCGTQVKAYDLIPVLSYIILRGKCRRCKTSISIRYPIIEIITAIFYIVIYKYFGLTFFLIKYTIMVSFLIIISIIDFDTQDVYAITTYPAIILGIVFSITGKYFFNDDFSNYLFGLIVAIGIIGFIVLITRGRGMGAGDIEIAAIIGVFLGFKNTLIAIFLAFMIGAIYGIILILKNSKKRKEAIAFGPFLFIGSVIALFYGSKIIELYINYVLLF